MRVVGMVDVRAREHGDPIILTNGALTQWIKTTVIWKQDTDIITHSHLMLERQKRKWENNFFKVWGVVRVVMAVMQQDVIGGIMWWVTVVVPVQADTAILIRLDRNLAMIAVTLVTLLLMLFAFQKILYTTNL